MVAPSNAPTSNAEEAEVEWFYEDLQDLLEQTPKKEAVAAWAQVAGEATPRSVAENHAPLKGCSWSEMKTQAEKL